MIVPEIDADFARQAVDHGASPHSRRLSDKVLSAFTHAYALGRVDLAERLMEILNMCGEQDGPDRSGKVLERAKAWMRYVQARNRYNLAQDSDGDGSQAAATALGEMKQAYGAWSEI